MFAGISELAGMAANLPSKTWFYFLSLSSSFSPVRLGLFFNEKLGLGGDPC
jgi:hypothetical protein